MVTFIAIQLVLLPLLLAGWMGSRLERLRIEAIYKRSLVRVAHLGNRR